MSKNIPTFKQQWVLYCCGDNNLLYVGNLRDSFGPFRIATDSVEKSFLRRMELSGWLYRDANPAFYHLTEKSKQWKNGNSKKNSHDYYNEYFKKLNP